MLLNKTLTGSLLLALLLACVQSAQAGVCSSYSTATTCGADSDCQWYLQKCIDLPKVNCRQIKDKNRCLTTRGCKYYAEPQWWVPPEYVETHYGNFDAPEIGCDTNTMCKRLTTSYWCNAYDTCGWVDGECKVAGTPANPNWVADCRRHKAWRYQDCIDLGPQCKYVSLKACDDNGKKCEGVLYGCRKAHWCNVDKGPFLKNQCNQMQACGWQNGKCAAVPTASPTSQAPTKSPSAAPTFRPTKSPSNSPTFKPTLSPTQKPTTGRPSRTPTKSPTNRPTPPTTRAPSKAPTPPTTQSPTRMPTTASPTKAKCPVTKGDGAIVCPNHPFAQLEQTFTVPATVDDKEYYCVEACAAGGAQGSYDVPVFPGCRAYTFDGTTCRLFGCFVGGEGDLQATTVATTGVKYGTLSASCYASGALPTPAPTKTCLYSNEAKPPAQVANSRPIANACKIYSATMSTDYKGDYRTRLDWCQAGCTNVFGSACVTTELYAITPGGAPAVCVYASCNTIQGTTINRVIYRSQKTSVC